MYFMLGDIALEAIDLTEFSETHAAEFAEHAVLKGKPRLQAMGEKLNELSFAIRLHHNIGGVESRYQALLTAKAEQQALALIWGRSKYKGDYVITQLTSNTLFTDKQGNALCREMTISLKEFVGNGERLEDWGEYDFRPVYDCYTSSPRDGGVRCKVINVADTNKWDLVELQNVTEAQIKAYFEQTQGKKYDLWGALGIVLGFKQRRERFFCSEWCFNAIFNSKQGWRFSPNQLATIFKKGN